MEVALIKTTAGATRSKRSGIDAAQAALLGRFDAKTSWTCAQDARKPRRNRTSTVPATVGQPDRERSVHMVRSPLRHIWVSTNRPGVVNLLPADAPIRPKGVGCPSRSPLTLRLFL